ncbi:thiamine diphosphokinase [Streptococcus cuniculipharyngis]|uniref:Thiamine diphosphokinase n=1 Tax=Streptococcus cuniculipharyngis TaxID=1562651 RepID=A0A5C5SCC3_9STRE|nr:thiamine diphosphokinase [Streptococcus cuniculipharyngis]TWS97631.1 thiamine diphosphokinase [Streptococcus cuniculipharyngis]
MPKIALFLGGDLSYFSRGFDGFVGVDRGCLALLQAGLPLDLAVGDFDSVSEEERQLILAQAKQLVRAKAEKNETDTELALLTVFNRWPQAQVTIFGALGGRLDHALANVFLPSHPDLMPFAGQITLRDQQNHISYCLAGQHHLSRQEGMTYISFLAESAGQLTIEGAKYPLTPQNYFQRKIYVSNEFTASAISLTLSSGYAVIIQSRDRS